MRKTGKINRAGKIGTTVGLFGTLLIAVCLMLFVHPSVITAEAAGFEGNSSNLSLIDLYNQTNTYEGALLTPDTRVSRRSKVRDYARRIMDAGSGIRSLRILIMTEQASA